MNVLLKISNLCIMYAVFISLLTNYIEYYILFALKWAVVEIKKF